ncbi:hypothetical protein PsorP6_013450 [Peronosclerospora sorghi]|uniref:Uncharacterized protein n=1 Tax=Peronosclerospora sorghi TaxID=230839 RepID=A0ACC0VJN2_9STRA|nr:hypothetical protein PsorP6_013450 [Peronosclerospora sorghi]
MNQPTTAAVFDARYDKARKHFSSVDRMYVFDGYCGVHEKTRLNCHPDFTVLNACNIVDEDWMMAMCFSMLKITNTSESHGPDSEAFVIFNIEEHMAIIGGTFYGGEMKKGISA